MNIKGILKVSSSFLYILSFLELIGLIASSHLHFCHGEHHITYAFLQTFCFTLLFATFLLFLTHKESSSLQLREAIVAVLSIWFFAIFFCSLPFSLSGALFPLDAIFETVSALTTTGATILQAKEFDALGNEIPIHNVITGFQNIEYSFFGTVLPATDPTTGKILTGTEAFPKALLLWRSLMTWVGGAGMILLFVALLPALGKEAKKLFRYESTGPTFSPLFPKARQTALMLLKIYLVFTSLCLLLLLFTNPMLSFFDALNIAFCTVSTGGFCTKNASIASYNNNTTELIVFIFMILGAINFSYYYELIKGRFYKLLEPEFLTFLSLLLILSLVVTFTIYGTKNAPLTPESETLTFTFPQALRHGFFQVASSMTTAGFASSDYDKWPFFAQAILVVSMFIGGMAGSTAAGLKIIRLCILWQCLRHAIHSIFKRNEVRVIRLGGREIDEETSFGVLAFFLTSVTTSLAGVLLLVLCNVDFETAFGLNASMINNSGASFRVGGPDASCAFLSPFAKWVCMLWMLLGRFEFYAIFTLFFPSFWKKE